MDSDLQLLLTLWFSDDVNVDAVTPLLQRLRADPEFRRAFAAELAMLGKLKAVQTSEPRWLELEDLLDTSDKNVSSDREFESRVMDAIDHAPVPDSQTHVRQQWHQGPIWAAAIAAMVSAIALAVWWNVGVETHVVDPDKIAAESKNQLLTNPHETAEHRSEAAIAVLSQAVDVEWGDENHPEIGDSLSPGNFVLRSGTVQLEFLSGVRLLLQSPADVELRAVDEILIRQGSASCFVTEMGRGFRILTKEMEVVDLGTAFSIDVQAGKQPEVHVREGSVEIKSSTAKTIELKERKAIRMSAEGPRDVAYAPERFPQPSALHDQQLERAQERYLSWQKGSRKLSADKSVLLHYTFEESDPIALELRNRATNAFGATDGVVIGCRWSEGRWPSKRSLLYRNAGDRVLFQVPGEHLSLTWLAWVRIDGLTQETTSLMMTEEPVRRKHFAHPGDQIVNDAVARRANSNVQTVRWELGGLRSMVAFNVGYGNARPAGWSYDKTIASQPATLSSQWGNWSCLAVTCDTQTGEVVHYRNGERIGEGKLTHEDPLLLDFMELGNLGVTADELEETGGHSQRRFYGAFDEVLIANRVFSEKELAEIWERGKP